MFDLWNGLVGGEHQTDHHDDLVTEVFEEIAGDYSTINHGTGYVDGCFGNDPLSQSSKYQCPDFPGVTQVESYVRADGTVVKAHLRTNPDGITSNNFSSAK
ncbi:hypothetical protein SAMN05880501_11640 [Ureibacillus xyleni]|uniref:Uncharacterized protein n=1 Tax=Ureibacillus xyleni TaxID=614648 RepID=A0A285TMJ9_9BACL|nr:hypothetical protein [Ureibacillus xyleni]SOC23918.1 hypothetical protein SAMN05880501_11640 [Ureibacillus xyleni]